MCEECVKTLVAEFDPTVKIGTHSMRAGGATLAANSGIAERLLKRHGRWRSDAYNNYVADSLENKLQVTKSMKL